MKEKLNVRIRSSVLVQTKRYLQRLLWDWAVGIKIQHRLTGNDLHTEVYPSDNYFWIRIALGYPPNTPHKKEYSLSFDDISSDGVISLKKENIIRNLMNEAEDMIKKAMKSYSRQLADEEDRTELFRTIQCSAVDVARRTLERRLSEWAQIIRVRFDLCKSKFCTSIHYVGKSFQMIATVFYPDGTSDFTKHYLPFYKLSTAGDISQVDAIDLLGFFRETEDMLWNKRLRTEGSKKTQNKKETKEKYWEKNQPMYGTGPSTRLTRDEWTLCKSVNIIGGPTYTGLVYAKRGGDFNCTYIKTLGVSTHGMLENEQVFFTNAPVFIELSTNSEEDYTNGHKYTPGTNTGS